TGPAATFYTTLLMTGTPDAFSQLSGEVHGSVQTTMIDDSRYIRQAVLGRLRQAPYAGGTGAIAALGSGGPTRGAWGPAAPPPPSRARQGGPPFRSGRRRSRRRQRLPPSRSGRRASAPGARSTATAMPPT